MTKKSLDRKLAQQAITLGRDTGKTDQEIYAELTESYYDKKSVALLITATATEQDKEKYKLYNALLVGILGVTIFFKVVVILNLSLATGQLWALLFVLLAPVFTLVFMYEIARYNAAVYRFCGMLTILNFLQSIEHMNGTAEVLVNTVFAAAIIGLSFYLDSRLFPNYSPRNLAKDGNGEFVLPQQLRKPEETISEQIE